LAKIAIVAGLNRSLINFRGDLIKEWVSRGHEVLAVAPGEEVTEQINALGARYTTIPLARTGLNPLQDFKTMRSLTAVFKAEKPDIVFLYTIKPVIYGSLAASRAKVQEIYSMITGLGYLFSGDTFKQRLLKRMAIQLYKMALQRNRKVFFQNPDDIRTFTSCGILSGHHQVVQINGSGVNIDRFAPAPLPHGPITFLLIARLIWDKGIGEYVEAAREIKKKYPDVRFKLVGPYDENPTAIREEDIERWEREKVIEYLGRTSDVRPHIEQANIYVLPSCYREGTPRTVLEAMSMGRPIITTDVPGCRETVKEGVNGFLVPAKDSRVLARTMERFIKEPGIMQEMGLQSRQIAEEKYDVHKVNSMILEAMGLSNARWNKARVKEPVERSTWP